MLHMLNNYSDDVRNAAANAFACIGDEASRLEINCRCKQNFEDLEETGKKGDALECTKYKGWSSCMAVYKDGTSAQAGRREGGMAGGREGAREPFSFHTDSICRLNCRN